MKTKEEKLKSIENQKRLLITSLILLFIMYLTNYWSNEICIEITGSLSCDSKKQWLWLSEVFLAVTLYFLNNRFLMKNKKPEKKYMVNIRSRPKYQKTKESFIKPPISSKKNHINDPKVKSQVDSVINSTKYTIDDNLPPVIENKSGGNRIYKKDFKGLQEYLKEMPNMDRIFNELTYSIRNGLTVKSYLKDANIMEDPEISNAALKGFFDIQEFLEGMYSINKNDELNKDISACKEAIQILQNIIPRKKSDDMDFDEEYLKIDQMLMSIDSYKKEYPFLKDFREKLKAGDIFLEDMDSYIKNQYGGLDGSEIMYTISLFGQIEHILAIHLNEWEENNDNVYKGFVEIEQYHSLSQKTIISLREMLTNQISDLGKPEKISDSKTRINWEDTEDIGIVTHYKGEPFTGICFSLNDNNNLDEETELVNGLKHGKSKKYINDGTLLKESNYKNDLLDGIIKWYSDGILSVESNYRKGENHGLHNEYDKEGRLSLQMNYNQGIKDGLYKEYENGELKEEGKYKDGQRDGLWKKYFNNSKLSEEGYYKEDERDGIWKIYNNSDKPERKVVYGKNEFEETEKSSNSSKKPIQNENGFNRIISNDGSFQEVYKERGLFTKEFKQFNDEGVLVCYIERIIHNNENDKKLLVDGIEKTYHQNGLLKTKVSFIKGQREGIGTEYDEDGWLVDIGYYKNDENVGWNNDKNMKLVLREILNIMDNQIPVRTPLLYMGYVETLGYKGDWRNEDPYYIISQSLI